jgi:hypothetical protein
MSWPVAAAPVLLATGLPRLFVVVAAGKIVLVRNAKPPSDLLRFM